MQKINYSTPVSKMNSQLVTTLEQHYTFIQLTSKTRVQEVDGNHIPIYLSGDNQPLDKFYQPIVGPVTAVTQGKQFSENPFTKDQFPVIFRPQNRPQLSIPNPRDFESQDDFVSALSAWYRQAMMFFSSAVLPTPISGCFYLPSLPKIFTREEKGSPSRYRTFKPNLWPLLPKNYLTMIDLVFSKDPIDPEEQFPEQIPKRDPILHKHHISTEKQWVGQMVPVEPKPFVYNTFDEFEFAFLNWATFTYDNLEIPPIPPAQFGSIAALERVEEVIDENRFKNGIIKPPEKPPQLCDFSWVPNKLFHIDKAGLCLQDLRTQLTRPAKFDIQKDPVLEVSGISDKQKFITEMTTFGIYYETHPTFIMHPKRFAFGVYAPNTNAAENLLYNPRNYTMMFIARVLETEFSQEQFHRLVSNNVSKTKVASIISNLINTPENLKTLFTYANRSPRHPIRLSYLLNSLVVHDIETNNQLIKQFLQIQNLNLFNNFVYYLNLTSQHHFELIPVMNNTNNPVLLKFNQFYLLQTLLTIFCEYNGQSFYQLILEHSKQMLTEVARYLRNEQVLKKLREAPVETDEYKALLMFAQCESPTIHRLILGPNFPRWMSETPNRHNVIWTFAHSSAINSASILFWRHCNEFAKVIDNYSPSVCKFIAFICQHTVLYADKLHTRFVGQVMLPFLESIIRSRIPHVSCMLVPVSFVLSSNQIVSNFMATDFRPLLVNAICRLCSTIVNAPPEIYKDKIVALTIFARQQDPCFAMSQVPNFAETIVEHLIDPNVQTLQQTWTFFNKFTQDPKILDQIFKRPNVKSSLVDIIKSTNRLAHKKFYRFAEKIWRHQDQRYLPIKKTLCDILISSIGTIVCSYNNRYITYKEDEKIRNRIEQFFSAIEGLQMVPGCQEFIQTMNRHMADNNKDSKPKKSASTNSS
ncbi:hypothetical protein TRFO_21285 [Tritrichomonas foetus]|uniref:Uncharacterized protein n=1 Tax=Tritrichomonas foetus TaxID=1144522 RepID=A0A1J4KE18_9EUKA|nr:hypothetical protein TRFO_21285 [Tritrichomonas foetus]|eukprot:OHT09679.1 hypothetical protein TRFO_21285 [Tritrichomonas foetus]